MIYFLLPNVSTTIYKYIDCLFSPDPPDITISNSLSHYLFEIKNKIKQYENDWNDYKKYTNPYEFINTIIPGKNKCVSKYKPLSRSYFKMIEILHFFIDNFQESEAPICTFHLAEGPGGFIEATANIRNNPADKYYGMTILDDVENCKIYALPEIQEKGMNVPGWKKTEYFLRTHPNIILEHGADKTGNILSIENFLYCRSKYGNSMDFITADGGFDFSVDFNNQEANILALLFAQICYAICLQKQGGHFVLKIFDCFMDHTVDILYILSSFYEKVYITKPQTSRYANSEKYVVCKNFLLANDNEVFPFLKNALRLLTEERSSGDKRRDVSGQNKDASQKMVDVPITRPECGGFICRFLKIPVSIYYINKLEEYNAIFGQQQIDNIYQTMILIENTCNQRYSRMTEDPKIRSDSRSSDWNVTERVNSPDTSSSQISSSGRICVSYSHNRKSISHPKIENLVRTNIQKCIQWCIKYNISYNSIYDSSDASGLRRLDASASTQIVDDGLK